VAVFYNDAALQEGIEAALWYAERSGNLQLRFLRKWKEAEQRMVAAPEINRDFGDGLRRCRFQVFPYALIYRILPDGVLEVIAVMHSSRRPGYWHERDED